MHDRPRYSRARRLGRGTHLVGPVILLLTAFLVTFDANSAFAAYPTTPTGLTAKAASPTSIKLTWNASSYTSWYRVFRGGVLVRNNVTTTALLDTGLAPVTSYSYQLAACSSVGCSAKSALVSAKTPILPLTIPTGLAASADTRAHVTVTWTPSPGATSYRVIRNGTSLPAQPSFSTYVDWNTAGSTAYSYVVKACNSTGCSSPSVAVSLTTPAVPPPPACTGVSLTPTSSLQAAIDGHPGGTTFCLSAGVYHLAASVVPKSNDVLWGTSGTVLTGDGVTADGIVGISTYQQGVVIRALSAERFTDSAIILGNNWLVEDSEISYAGGLGLQLQDGATLRDDYFHHNGRRGFGGVDVHNVLVVGNEIAYNNTIHATDGSAGGAKVLMSDGVTFRNNYVHNNYFSGLHCDTDCINFTYEGNVIEGNTGKGLLYEKGYTATIRNNLIAGNDSLFAATTLNFGANLRLNTSMDVEVYGNVIEATVPGTNGISLADYDRGTGPLGTYALANDYVHDNVIRLLDGQSGLVGKTHDPTHANNRFVANHYYVPALSAQYFAWQAYPLTWKIWRSNGQDGTGTWSQG